MQKPFNLYHLFKEENERYKDLDITIFYNKARCSMQYSDDTGTMTVLFRKNEFYWRKAEIREGIGIRFFPDRNNQPRFDIDILSDMPEKMSGIALDYQYQKKMNIKVNEVSYDARV